jgi:single-strand DNA-binding protein
VPCSFFGKTAELLAKYATKGSQLRVNGEFSVRKYTDKDGNEKTMTEIRAQDFQLLGSRPDGAQGGGAPARAPAPAPAPKPAGGGYGAMDDDVPFAPCRMWF